VLIVFDLDGTLIDSAHDLAASASELVTSFGGRPPAVAEATMMVGEGAATLVRRVLDAGGLDPATPGALARFLHIYDRRLLDHTVAYRGIREVLPIIAQRAQLAVLTNKPLAPSERILNGLGLAWFFATVIGGDGPHGRKPDPTGLRALMGTDPAGGAALVGDSPIDWNTAQAAGCPFVWARYGFGAARFQGLPPNTPYVIDTPADLPAIVDRLAALKF
jgi:phosphoglycolate phosphatase